MNKNSVYQQQQQQQSYYHHYNSAIVANNSSNNGSRYYPSPPPPSPQTNYKILTKNDTLPVVVALKKRNDSICGVSHHKTLSTVCENEVSTASDKVDSVNSVNNEKFVTPVDCYIPQRKLPLHNTWSFWYIKNDRLKNWKDNLIKLIDFSYVEDFWAIYNYLVSPSALETGTDLALFKKGIEPMWEDVENKTGGRWLLTFNSQSSNELDDIWLYTILALIGDNFCGMPCKQDDLNKINSEFSQESDHICGSITGVCVQNRPKIDKLSLWTKNYKNEALTRYVGRKWKENANISQTITFEPHDNQYSKASNSKLIYKE